MEDCRFCREREPGEMVTVANDHDWWSGDTQPVKHYGPIFYCPLCGRRLRPKATLD